MIIAQYYQFLRLGFEGYRRIMVNLTHIATRLRKGVEDTGTANLNGHTAQNSSFSYKLCPLVPSFCRLPI